MKIHFVVIMAFLLVNSFGLLVANAVEISLYKQLENQSGTQPIHCNDHDHILVVRSNMKLACVHSETSEKLFWPAVIFNEDDKSIVHDSINVKSHENNHRVSYTILDGFLHDMEYDDSFDSLTVKIHSIDNGELYMIIPKVVFEDRSDKQFVNIMILENMEEIDFIDTSDSDNYKLKLNFTNSNPIIEIIQTYVP